MLRAIAIYDCSNVNKPKLLASAQQDKSNTLFTSSQLENFETNSLGTFLKKIAETNPSSIIISDTYISQDEFQYVTKLPADSFFIVICSRKFLYAIEVMNLFFNINYQIKKSDDMNSLLNDVIINPLGYLGHDKKIDHVLAEVEKTKGILLEAVDKAIENSKKNELLSQKADELKNASINFHRQSKKVNPCCF